MNQRQRRSLSFKRDPATSRNKTDEGTFLCEVLDQCGEWRRHTHPFHTYPGRMHPDIAKAILAKFPGEGGPVLDPFCGSGTTLVEATLAGRPAYGLDVHPLAVRIARVKCSLWPTENLEVLAQEAQKVGEEAEELARKKGKSTSDRKPHRDEAKWFQPHIRYELANIRSGIDAVENSRIQDALEIALSSILVKVSNRRSDSNAATHKPNLSRGFTSQFYQRRCEELVQFLNAFQQDAPEGAKSPKIREGDARELHRFDEGIMELVICSPPYVGTYDYFSHQAMRSGVLGIGDARPRKREIGGRTRAKENPTEALATWERDLIQVLHELHYACKPKANAFFVLGSSRVGHQIIPNEKILARVASKAGFTHVATASQKIHRIADDDGPAPKGPPQQEHLVWLRRDDKPHPERRRPSPGPRGRRPQGRDQERGRGPRDRGRDDRAPWERDQNPRGRRQGPPRGGRPRDHRAPWDRDEDPRGRRQGPPQGERSRPPQRPRQEPQAPSNGGEANPWKTRETKPEKKKGTGNSERESQDRGPDEKTKG